MLKGFRMDLGFTHSQAKKEELKGADGHDVTTMSTSLLMVVYVSDETV